MQETDALSGDRTGQRLVSTQTVQHDYLTLSGRVARETITTDGTVTAVLDFIYDSQGRPFALNYSENGGSSFTTYYYVLNLQGDVVKLISYIPGFEYEEVASYTYDAWGNIISATGEKAELNPLRYRGYYYDSETGFYYLQSRYYDPANHRFINADGYESTGQGFVGTNMFAYCGNNPVLFEDQNGELGIIVVSLLFAGVSAAVDYGMQVISNYENGYTGKEAWVDNISFGSVASAAFSGALAPSTFCIGSALADFILSPAIELSVDYAISPTKNEPLTLENYTIKQMERFGDTCITEIINGAIPESCQNSLTSDAIQSTVKGIAKSNTVNTIWTTIKSFIMTIIE